MPSITVNKRPYNIPNDFGTTPQELARTCGFTSREYEVYRSTDKPKGAHLDGSDKCTEPVTVDDGDEFVIIPKYINGG